MDRPRLCRGTQRLGLVPQSSQEDIVFGCGALMRSQTPFDLVCFGFDVETCVDARFTCRGENSAQF